MEVLIFIMHIIKYIYGLRDACVIKYNKNIKKLTVLSIKGIFLKYICYSFYGFYRCKSLF